MASSIIGSSGGHRTVTRVSPTRHASPASSLFASPSASRAAPSRALAPCPPTGPLLAPTNASYATPGTPIQPISATSVSPCSPPVWSSWACVRTKTSTRRKPYLARARRNETGSGPQSTSMLRPPSRTRIASPCPTSKATTDMLRAGAGPKAAARVHATRAPARRRADRFDPGKGHKIHAAVAVAHTARYTIGLFVRATAAPGSAATRADIHAHASSTAAENRKSAIPATGNASKAMDPPRPVHRATVTIGPA